MSPQNMCYLMDQQERLNIPVNAACLEHFAFFRQRFRGEIIKYENTNKTQVPNLLKEIESDFYWWKRFEAKYETWKKQVVLLDNPKENPWKQFLTSNEIDDKKTLKKLKDYQNFENKT